MARYRLALSAVADADLADIYREGVRQWGLPQADRYYSALGEHFERLCENPYLYRAVDDLRPGYRRSVCGRHAIYFRIEAETIVVMTVIKHQNLSDRLD
ncbi:type II toxin-antitoxin system RelE/ParE family toxin [Maricaulaceae bacterium MS644]